MESRDIRDQATLEAFLVTHQDMLDLDAIEALAAALFTARQIASAAAAASLAGASGFQMSVDRQEDGNSSEIDVTFEFNDGIDELRAYDTDETGLLPEGTTMESLLDEAGWGQPTLCLSDTAADLFSTVLEKCGRKDSLGYFHLPLDIQPRQVVAAILGRDPFALATAIDQKSSLAKTPTRSQRRRRG